MSSIPLDFHLNSSMYPEVDPHFRKHFYMIGGMKEIDKVETLITRCSRQETPLKRVRGLFERPNETLLRNLENFKRRGCQNVS